MAAKAYENPLLPNARMLAMYRTLLELAVLSRAGYEVRFPACRIAAMLDLTPADRVSDDNPMLAAFVRGAGSRTGPAPAASLRGLAALGSSSATPGERMLCAVGWAGVLKDLAASYPAASGGVVAFADAAELSASSWLRVLTLAAEAALPLVILALPSRALPGPRARQPDFHAIARRAAPAGFVPVIPVDAGDTVALYRVVQESLVRARTDGGVALIDCMDLGTNPIALLAGQLSARGIATTTRLAQMEASAGRLASRLA